MKIHLEGNSTASHQLAHRSGGGKRAKLAIVLGVLSLAFLNAPAANAGANATIYTSLANGSSKKCLSIYGGGAANGTPAVQWTCMGHGDQMWALSYVDGKFFKIVNMDNKCLETPDWRQDRGVQLRQWDCHGGNSQLWSIYYNDGGNRLVLGNKHSEKCISAEGGQQGDGVRIIQWDCTGAADQLWSLK
ncbi:RICIN domain-containing protein (plasmid) [Kitasatospora purpeofusca]|uniref:RICIN domain-containing protein n=1 Tax=Kitasatospora purpeofusca TaxID=67352 RepID=UPI002E0FB18A|nr:RICIN domain-containing protein [Kitasatospora purpeofusca]